MVGDFLRWSEIRPKILSTRVHPSEDTGFKQVEMIGTCDAHAHRTSVSLYVILLGKWQLGDGPIKGQKDKSFNHCTI